MTPWNELHLTYFVGYAMWSYFATPFCFAMPDFVTRELDSHTENWTDLAHARGHLPGQRPQPLQGAEILP
jgi:hypothetical protein